MTGRKRTSLQDDIALASNAIAVFRKDGAITAAALPARWYNNTGRDQVVKSVHAAVGTAPTGHALTVDVKISTVSVFATSAGFVSITAAAFAAEAVPNHTAVTVADGAYLTVEVAAVGSSVAGSDLVVQVALA